MVLLREYSSDGMLVRVFSSDGVSESLIEKTPLSGTQSTFFHEANVQEQLQAQTLMNTEMLLVYSELGM